MAINKNEEIRKLHTFGDKIADSITATVGSMPFLVVNAVTFTLWLLVNAGFFGERYIFDPFPFGFLTTAVSLEAIILSVFVLISQKRQARLTELRSELDYRIDLESEVEIKTIVAILQRLAEKQDIDVNDLIAEMVDGDRTVARRHPVTAEA